MKTEAEISEAIELLKAQQAGIEEFEDAHGISLMVDALLWTLGQPCNDLDKLIVDLRKEDQNKQSFSA